ncbi:MAG: ribosomal protein S18-alanine N-acetyltransferase [Oscillospiraceae bacterium]|nr:ribosomal protein S18-alanine N-acetyltransferase [Oscillospiraceae bacterium]
MSAIIVTPAADADMEDIHAIECASFSLPWTQGQLLRELYGEDSYFSVARDTERGDILGYVILREIGYEAELMNIAAREASRRRGVASALMRDVIEHARNVGIANIFLEARASNAAALRLYEKHGFMRVGQRRGYYDCPHEDAVIMKLDI